MASQDLTERALSRRDFLKGASVVGGAVGAGALLAACDDGNGAAPPAAGAEGDYILEGLAGTPWALPKNWDMETDVVVIGTGDAGCPAAIRAFDGGADVIMIDKGDYFGGSSVLGGGNSQLACTHVQIAQGVEDNAEWAFEDQMEFGLYRSNPEVLQAWIDNSEPYVTWSEEVCKIEWGELGLQEPARVPRSHRAAKYDIHNAGSGVILSIHFFKQIEERKIPVLLEHKMTKIYRVPNGPVHGIEVETPEGIKNIKARKAVIVATGGFKGNSQMTRAWHPQFDETLIWSGWPDVNPTGDGHLAIMNIGGGVVDMSFIMEFSGRLGSRQYVRWDRPHFDNPSTNTGLPNGNLEHVIFVNNSGKRYLNEDHWEAGHTLPWLPHMIAFLQIEGRPRMEWLVTDSPGAEDIGWTRFEADFLNPDPTKSPCVEPGWVAKADTIADLATQMGVPAAELEATIARYNEQVAAGKDEDYERENLFPILEPPFWAARWCRMSHDQCTGIRVNPKMQIVEQMYQWQPESGDSVPISQEAVIPHLYAAGECTGGTGGAVRGSGKRGWYQVHGYIAGDLAAKETALT